MKKSNRIVTLLVLTTLISAFLYSCDAGDTNKPVDKEAIISTPNYMETGKEVAMKAQSVLAKNLVNAINTGGSGYAVEFCNTKALVLTDSMALVLHAQIKRVTDKTRNAANQANENELKYIQSVKDKMLRSEKPEPAMTEIAGKMVGYYPIVSNQLCLQCHGTKDKDIETATFQKINKLYPHDNAIGYRVNELRGIWVVEMNKSQ